MEKMLKELMALTLEPHMYEGEIEVFFKAATLCWMVVVTGKLDDEDDANDVYVSTLDFDLERAVEMALDELKQQLDGVC